MVLNCWYTFVVLLILCVCSSCADDNELLHRLVVTEDLVKALSHRVDLLETREQEHLQRIVDLESSDQRQQKTIEELKHQLQVQSKLVEVLNEAESTVDNKGTDKEPNGTHPENMMERRLVTDRGSIMPRIRQANVESPVAFLAQLSNPLTHAGVKQIIVFDKVITNVGSGYNAAIGIFTAPVEGIYVFSTTVTQYSNGDVHASFYHNNNIINMMYANVSGKMTSSTITLHLQKGDVVTVRNDDPDDAIQGNLHTSFTGFLLCGYESVQPIIGK